MRLVKKMSSVSPTACVTVPSHCLLVVAVSVIFERMIGVTIVYFHIQSFNEEVLFLQHEVWHDIYSFCIGMTSVEIKRLYPLLVLIKGTF